MEIVTFDVDGVLADFEGCFREKFGNSGRNEYKLEKRYKNMEREIRAFVSDPETYENLDVIFLGRYLYERCLDDGFYIEFLTSRPVSAWNTTCRWLKKNGFAYPNASVDNLTMPSDKLGYLCLQEEKPLFIVDDNPEFAKEAWQSGFEVALMDQEWNRNVPSWMPRLSSRKDIEHYLEHIIAKHEILMDV